MIEQTPALFSNITADKVVLVANNAAVDGSGNYHYDVARVDKKLQALFGVRPMWAPIGPVVADTIRQQGIDVNLVDEYWLNLLAMPEAALEREGFVSDRPVIGRHSRPQPAKWPAQAEEILAVYPDDESVQVEILGGSSAAAKVLGSTPASWNVIPFGGENPRDFLQRIDFWVYFHHHDLREAFGRAAMEALAAGAVVILPEYLRETYGDAALYASPETAMDVVRAYYDDRAAFLEQSRKGQAFVRKFDPSLHGKRLRDLGIVPTAEESGRAIRVPKIEMNRKRRILFVTSNGAGMGHLTRLLSVATRLPDDAEPVFASLSSAVDIVGRYGMPYEYIGSRDGLGMESRTWRRYSRERFRILLDEVAPDTLVFDGTWPYPSFREAFGERAQHAVWMRRPMWKEDTTTRPLSWASEFDAVIEPGELAESYDAGPTTDLRDAVKIAPITLLSENDLLSRSEARRRLGYNEDDKVVLITLGAGNINDIGSLQETVLGWFANYAPGWRVVMTKPPIAHGDSLHGVETLQVYPLAEYTRAFDFAVSAAGYNAFHEWTRGALPTVWIPNDATRTDDQVARARWAADQGLGLHVPDDQPQLLEMALAKMTDSANLIDMHERLAGISKTNGGAQAAALLMGETL
ncbi:hypothetical protein [Nesterenkonia rhizosphaerae]|uniref:hypothetical protein n=1 Tax=Nesterenkonia rhizosphaerae TaxID=1348272 RepID=UPI0031E960AD